MALMAQLGVKHKLSITYYPQTDGQTERVNQTLEQYLRYFYNYQQTNWVRLLSIGIITYNTSEHSITKRTPFFINKKFEADVSIKIRKCEELVPYIVIIMERIYKLQNKL